MAANDRRSLHRLPASALHAALHDQFPVYPADFDSEDFLHAEGLAVQALLCLDLFFPSLDEVEGNIFLRQAVEDPEQRQRVIEALRVDQHQRVQESFNRLELAYAFHRYRLTSSASSVLALAVAHAWELWLPDQFKGRAFRVSAAHEPGVGQVVAFVEP